MEGMSDEKHGSAIEDGGHEGGWRSSRHRAPPPPQHPTCLTGAIPAIPPADALHAVDNHSSLPSLSFACAHQALSSKREHANKRQAAETYAGTLGSPPNAALRDTPLVLALGPPTDQVDSTALV